MTKITETCIEPYLDSFMRSFTEANYKPETIKGYRNWSADLDWQWMRPASHHRP